MTVSRQSDHTLSLPADFPKHSERLGYVPSTKALAKAESDGKMELSRELSAEPPQGWPLEVVTPAEGDGTGWHNCYVTFSPSEGGTLLVGLAGVKRWSVEHRTMQVGTSIVPEHHGQHFGQEVVATLGHWGLSQEGIDRVICDVPVTHPASAKSLQRAGYVKLQESPTPGFFRFEMRKS
jgi:RimJ/RimL family protein N-acetyltransferase